eukprot:scaffold9678_cov79-Cyclotella_meneghiniana.AAC.6
MDLWLVVLVSILVFSVFIIAPSGSANSLNLSSKGSTSCSATIALQSSTYTRIKLSVPLLSSPLIPSSSCCDASDTSTRVGSAFLDWGIVMYFSTPFLMVEMTILHLPCTPTAKLRAIAVILQIADGIPSGRSFVLSSASFSRATRHDFCICDVLEELSDVGWIDAVLAGCDAVV